MSNDASRAIVRAEHLLAIEPFISDEETRYYLNGVYIEPHPNGGAILVCTDGHMMAVIHDPQAVVTGLPQIWRKEIAGKDTLKCPMATWAKLNKPVSKSSSRASSWQSRKATDDDTETPAGPMLTWCELRHSLTEPDKIRLVSADSANSVLLGNGETFFTREKNGRDARFAIDGTFPEYRRCVPTHEGATTFSPAFYQARYLDKAATFGAAMRAASHPGESASKSIPMCVRTDDPGAPAIVRFGGVPDAFLVLMPVRESAASLAESLPQWFTGKTNVVELPKKKAA